jgi:hypothetical protein
MLIELKATLLLKGRQCIYRDVAHFSMVPHVLFQFVTLNIQK